MGSPESNEGGSKVKFIFRKAEDYKLHFANGAYGGLTPHGDLVCNFFFEYRSLPDMETADIIEGKLYPIESSSPEVEMIRELQTGVIMTPNEAKNLAQWLLQKVEEFEKSSR